MKKCALISFLSLLIAVPSYAQTVIRDGKEWLQPADFLSLRWTDDVVAICPAPGFECTGTLNTTDVTGYTLASIEDVTALLNSYIDTSTPLTPAPAQTPVTNAEFDALLADFSVTTNDGRVVGQSSTVSVQNNNWPRGGGLSVSSIHDVSQHHRCTIQTLESLTLDIGFTAPRSQ